MSLNCTAWQVGDGHGPEDTPYTGGVFELNIYFPSKLLEVPPKVQCGQCSNIAMYVASNVAVLWVCGWLCGW